MNRKQRRAQGHAKRHAQGHAQNKSGQLAASGADMTKAADPAALHEAGIQAYRAGRLAMAADLIGQAISVVEPVPEFHYNLAIVLKAQGRLEDAAAHYERAVALKPDHVNAHNNLGNVWKALGQTDKARASFAQALQHNPGNADTHYSLGILCCDLGEREEAERHFRRCLACDPGDGRGVAILLAYLGAGDAPARTSQAQLLSVYDVRSRFWDQESGYFGAALVAEALRRRAQSAALDMLDIGCGTGLVGAQVRDLAARLDGVDISSAMLEKAKARGVYNNLFEGDIATFLAQHEDSYDAVLGAATLIHFGDLSAIFESVSRSLRDKGLFVFTLFPHEADDAVDYAVASNYRLAQSGCFGHTLSYVERLARATGFSVVELRNEVHELDQDGHPVSGILALLRVTR